MPLPLEGLLVPTPGRRVVICRPNPRAYGHLALEVLYAHCLALDNRAALLLVRPDDVVSDALYEMRSASVNTWTVGRMLRRSNLLWDALKWILPPPRGAMSATRLIRERKGGEWSKRIDTVGKRRGWSKGRRQRLKEMVALLLGVRSPRDVSQPYYRRKLIRDSESLHLRTEVREDADRALERLGISPGRPLVSLHVRGSGFKAGRENHDKPRAVEAISAIRDDTTRNAHITAYIDALERLVARGFIVVRIGDASMEPIELPGVIDLATSSAASSVLELEVISRSAFLLGSESGPQAVVYLTGTPSLIVNATDPISSYPIRPTDLLLPKRVVDLETERMLAVEEMLGAEYQHNLRNTFRYRYIDNRPEELVAAVEEMLTLLETSPTASQFQRRFRVLATDAATALKTTHRYVRKWGADEGFLGDGRIAEIARQVPSDAVSSIREASMFEAWKPPPV